MVHCHVHGPLCPFVLMYGRTKAADRGWDAAGINDNRNGLITSLMCVVEMKEYHTDVNTVKNFHEGLIEGSH